MSYETSNSSNSKLLPAAGPAPVELLPGSSLCNQNVRGVQFLREGNIRKAVSVLRSLVLPPGGTWTRPNVPNVVKRNFATALLLDGHPSGCLELLAEMRDDQHLRVRQLQAAIKRWEKTLSLLQWLNWRTGWIEPSNRPITIDFIPGELEDGATRTDSHAAGSTDSHLSTAI